MTDQEATEKRQALEAFSSLLNNAAWAHAMQPIIEKARATHLEGCTSLALSPQERSEHVHAYHLALSLLDAPKLTMDKLRRELAEFAKDAHARGGL